MEIVTYPHPMLSYVSKPLRRIGSEIREIAEEMFELMYTHGGVGLAANQVNLPYQLFVMNETGNREEKSREHCFINPVIQKRKGREEDNEGCLSFPDLRIFISRAVDIRFQAITLDGELVQYNWKGFPARIVQHESDHLFGHCFYEKAPMTGQLKARDILDSLESIYDHDEERGFHQTQEEFLSYVAEKESGWV